MFSLITQAGPKGIIVKSKEVWPPEDKHGEAGSQHHTDQRAQAGRPLIERTERGRRPIKAPNEGRHLASTR